MNVTVFFSVGPRLLTNVETDVPSGSLTEDMAGGAIPVLWLIWDGRVKDSESPSEASLTLLRPFFIDGRTCAEVRRGRSAVVNLLWSEIDRELWHTSWLSLFSSWCPHSGLKAKEFLACLRSLRESPSGYRHGIYWIGCWRSQNIQTPPYN